MSQLKTRPNNSDVNSFIADIPQERKRADSMEIAAMMKRAVGAEPRMWGTSIVGFGSYRYRYETTP